MHALLLVAALAAPSVPAQAPEAALRLPRSPRISPDGNTIAFAWRNDVWTAPIEGGAARRITVHAANDTNPAWAPDGGTLYFESNRGGNVQIWATDAEGTGVPRQITHTSTPKRLLEATADGEGLLVRRRTDRGWHYSEENRAYVVDLDGEEAPRRLFDAGLAEATLSPDGSRVLFVRGRSAWNRKAYEGPQAAQLWLADLSGDAPSYERLDEDRERFQNVAAMSPIWSADGKSAYYLSDPNGVFDLYRMDLASGDVTQVTDVGADGNDDGVAFPSLSRDGRTLLFRRGFDLVRMDTKSGAMEPIELFAASDVVADAVERIETKRADEAAFTPDGKQMAFVAAHDLWVMDRILKEPRRVTSGEHVESDLVFSEDGGRLFFVSDKDGESDIWVAELGEEANGVWWLPASEITVRRLTDDREVERSLARAPKGGHIAYTRGTNLFVMDDDGTDRRQVAAMWSTPDFDWSPDGRWLTYATQDDDYNGEIFVVPTDGTREPFNLSRHPDNDYGPRWSQDGKRIAWIGRRSGDETDIHWIELTNASDEATERDEKLEEALKAMEPKKGKKGGKKGADAKAPKGEDAADAKKDGEKADAEKDESAPEKDEDLVEIDFEGIHDRMHTFSNRESSERGLVWYEGGEKLAFSASIDGQSGLWSIEFPRPKKAESIGKTTLGGMEWLAEPKEFVGLTGGTPTSMSPKGKTDGYAFEVRSTVDWRTIREAAFDEAWRAMRDRFYDEAYNNKDWYQIRAKYRPVAAQCIGAGEFTQLCNMMLGELNASHMGHYGGRDPLPDFKAENDWTPRTLHLGLRFDANAEGPGLLVESVIPGSPAARERSRVEAGERVLEIDGTKVGPGTDVERLLTLEAVRDVTLVVKAAKGEETREVTIRPVTSVGTLLYPEWVEDTRRKVEELSNGRLGYLHIKGMNFGSFRQMEEDLYAAGYGKDGLVIDVRFNGGGSTTDHVLTALTQPVHAITQSRGSGEGYPQDRKIYASWSKPIVLMCNEHSFSNAEILSHAIKQIGRGKLVGMRTAGGVISTGSVGMLDGGMVRMPMRGWYLSTTGEDMELNGAEPDVALWNAPDWSSPGGEDRQLARAVEVLMEDVKAKAEEPKPKLVPASHLRR